MKRIFKQIEFLIKFYFRKRLVRLGNYLFSPNNY